MLITLLKKGIQCCYINVKTKNHILKYKNYLSIFLNILRNQKKTIKFKY